jgi:hypothetical protein
VLHLSLLTFLLVALVASCGRIAYDEDDSLCDDGEVNGFEEGRDCGGPCAPCGPNRISAFHLLNVATGEDLGPMQSQHVVQLSRDCDNSPLGCTIEVIAEAPENGTEAIRMNIDLGAIGPTTPESDYWQEHSLRYLLCGWNDVPLRSPACPQASGGFTLGQHTLNATPYGHNDQIGGPPASLAFQVEP